MTICAIAVVLGGIVQYPWYDAMFFPLLALLPASGLDGWLVGRAVLISGVVLPGIGIKDDQYRARADQRRWSTGLLVRALAAKPRPGRRLTSRKWR